MLRIWVGILLLSGLLAAIGHSQVLSAGLSNLFVAVSNFVFSLLCPLWLMTLFLVPGFYVQTADAMRAWGVRLVGSRDQIDDLRRKIAHMDKPHHMLQLGQVYVRQKKFSEAATWFEKCLAREPNALDAQYGLAQCRFAAGQYPAAAELLEKVYAVRPDHDYGTAYLRLAQAQTRSGNAARAREVFEQMLRFYPGHPEGSYDYALLLDEAGQTDKAVKLMQDVIASVRLSPSFQRRRNRHWALKARWWLWRRGQKAAA